MNPEKTPDRTPWIIGGAVAAIFACSLIVVVCAAAFFLLLWLPGGPQPTRLAPLPTPPPIVIHPTLVAPGQGGGSATVIDVSVDDDPALGPDTAPVTIIEFSDFECPFCKRFRDETFDQIMTQYKGQVRLVYRDFPLTSIHPEAMNAALAADCANEQGKFWEMHDQLFANQDQLGASLYKSLAGRLKLDQQKFNQCYDAKKYLTEVQHDMADGESYGVTGTPTFFINGQVLVGAQPFSAFDSLISEALK